MKLYTKHGDEGQTDLFGGQRVEKDELRVAAYGTVDELNSAVGLAAAGCTFDDLRDQLLSLQSRLFELGADLATPRTPGQQEPRAIPRIEQDQIDQLEQWIDSTMKHVPPMKHFVLPGGTDVAARLDFARCVCRRAERLCVTLSRQDPGLESAIVFLNRLSDLLFALARRANQLASHPDVPWESPHR